MEGISTKDYWTIIALLVAEHVPSKIEANHFEETGKCQLIYHFGKEAEEDYERWMRGVPDDPLGTIRKAKEAIEGFKHNLHRYNSQ